MRGLGWLVAGGVALFHGLARFASGIAGWVAAVDSQTSEVPAGPDIVLGLVYIGLAVVFLGMGGARAAMDSRP